MDTVKGILARRFCEKVNISGLNKYDNFTRFKSVVLALKKERVMFDVSGRGSCCFSHAYSEVLRR